MRTLDLVSIRKWFFLVSGILTIASLAILAIPPALKPGIEFTSGTTMLLAFENSVDQAELRSEFGSLAHYVWRYEPAPHERPALLTREVARTLSTSAASTAMSKDLKKRGWSFVGPTTVYAFMQAMGLVNDHLEGCHSRAAALQARAGFERP